MADTVRQYIARQREHHTRQSLQDEYLEILRKHEIEFDLKYVFEKEIVESPNQICGRSQGNSDHEENPEHDKADAAKNEEKKSDV